jgi:hypothetical protein
LITTYPERGLETYPHTEMKSADELMQFLVLMSGGDWADPNAKGSMLSMQGLVEVKYDMLIAASDIGPFL